MHNINDERSNNIQSPNGSPASKRFGLSELLGKGLQDQSLRNEFTSPPPKPRHDKIVALNSPLGKSASMFEILAENRIQANHLHLMNS